MSLFEKQRKAIETNLDELAMLAFDEGWNAVVDIIHKTEKELFDEGQHLMAEGVGSVLVNLGEIDPAATNGAEKRATQKERQAILDMLVEYICPDDCQHATCRELISIGRKIKGREKE